VSTKETVEYLDAAPGEFQEIVADLGNNKSRDITLNTIALVESGARIFTTLFLNLFFRSW
jgi:hypothetical protein